MTFQVTDSVDSRNAARQLRISSKNLLGLLLAGRVRGEKILGRWVVPLIEIERVSRERKVISPRCAGSRGYSRWP